MLQQSKQTERPPTTDQQDGTRRAWDAIAAGFDEYVTPANMALAEEALDHAGVRAGERLLDVAAGSGALSIGAAWRVGTRDGHLAGHGRAARRAGTGGGTRQPGDACHGRARSPARG